MAIETFTTAKIRDLLNAQHSPCISIYLPTHPAGKDAKEDSIRYHNLIRLCERQLNERGLTGERAQRMLEPALALINTTAIWNHARSCLAVFIAPDVFNVYVLPHECREQAHVGTHFYIRPLIPLLSSDGEFRVLVLSQGRVALYMATLRDLQEEPLPDAPHRIEDLTKYDQLEGGYVQRHAGPRGGHTQAAVYHGQGSFAGKDQRKRMAAEYVKAVRKAVEKKLATDTRPLVLVAPEYIQSVYREGSHYPHLLAEGVVIGPDHMENTELHEAAWNVARPYFTQRMQDRVAQYANLLGTGQASDQLEEIVSAAEQGRVDTLFIDPRSQAWGAMDNGRPVVHAKPQKGDEELLDRAARHTLSNSGLVFALEPDRLSSRGPASAVFRY
jgi:hypothetical protein